MSKLFSLMVILGAAVLFATAMRDTTSATAAQESKGKKVDVPALYKQHCLKCHNADGKGHESFKSLDIPDFTNAKWQASRTDKELTESVTKGKGVMPGFEDPLSKEEINALIQHVRAFGPDAKKKK